MKVKREVSTIIKFIIDNFFPPLLRDSKLFLWIPFKMQFGNLKNLYFDFRDNAYDMTDKEFAESYRKASDTLIHDGTDLNNECFNKILDDVIGSTVFEIACGRGDLSKALSKKYEVTASDLVYSPEMKKFPGVKFVQANIEKLPFEDKSFDTVISTHTLEHTRDIVCALNELRRVCKMRLIVVLPKERPYKYGFNFHLHFFPYKYNIYSLFRKSNCCTLSELDGDWYYKEDTNYEK